MIPLGTIDYLLIGGINEIKLIIMDATVVGLWYEAIFLWFS